MLRSEILEHRCIFTEVDTVYQDLFKINLYLLRHQSRLAYQIRTTRCLLKASLNRIHSISDLQRNVDLYRTDDPTFSDYCYQTMTRIITHQTNTDDIFRIYGGYIKRMYIEYDTVPQQHYTGER